MYIPNVHVSDNDSQPRSRQARQIFNFSKELIMSNYYSRAKLFFLFFVSFISSIYLTSTNACTRVLFNTGNAVLVGNNMDWPEDMQTDLMVFPRGQVRASHVSGSALTW